MAAKRASKAEEQKPKTIGKARHSSSMTFMNMDSLGRMRFAVDQPEGKGLDLHLSRVVCQIPDFARDELSMNIADIEVKATIMVEVEARYKQK